MDHTQFSTILVLVMVIAAGLALFHPRLAATPTWRATVTPLASIIGSGFLVLAPVLVREFGVGAVLVMAGLCGLAYLIGMAIRFNIRVFDRPGHARSAWEQRLERLSEAALAFAYVISVCYYLNLLGAFAMSQASADDPFSARLLTSAVLVFIAVLGWRRGLAGLEKAEVVTVGIKLAVIAGLLAGLAYYTGLQAQDGALQLHDGHFTWDSLRLAFGLLITVQGFETSRYLGAEHDADTRIRTMRYAQWLATAIYLVYIGLAGLSFPPGDVGQRETAVIGMTAQISPVLPLLLVAAALAAQFSAAVADTNGCGGLAEEMSGGRLRTRTAYLVLAALALLLTWTADIYQIISYASRAFAVYYALQCALAAVVSRRQGDRALRTAGFATLTGVLVLAAVLGVPAE